MFLGIDLGTTNLKVVLVDEADAILAEASEVIASTQPHPNWSEQEPADWIAACERALGALRLKAPKAYAAVRSIGFSGQMHGLVALSADDRPLRPCILHNDGRAAAEAASIAARLPDLAEEAGVLCMPSFVAPKILWLRKNEPDIAARMIRIVMPKDMLRLWLTGLSGTDVVDAAGAWLLDERRRQWSQSIAGALGISPSLLPSLHESTDVVGRIRPGLAEALGLPRGVAVVAGAGDAAVASVGLGHGRTGDAFISLGTASQVFVTCDAYRPSIATLVHCFAHALPGRWFQMAAMLNGAAVLAWWAGICGVDPGALIAEAEGAPDRDDAPFFLPYLAGERTPHNNAAARGSFHQLAVSTDRAAMTRAVLESIAFSLCDARDALAAAGSPIGQLGLSGGGARSLFWTRMIADALGVPLTRYKDASYGPAFGAARLARIGLTGETADEVCRKPEIEMVVEPNKAAGSRLAPRLERWRGYYRALNR